MSQKFSASDLETLTNLTPDQIAKMSFEIAVARLEQVVDALEQEGTPLQMGLKLYEVGTSLSRRCANVLDATEARMVQIRGDLEARQEVDFDPEKDGR